MQGCDLKGMKISAPPITRSCHAPFISSLRIYMNLAITSTKALAKLKKPFIAWFVMPTFNEGYVY